MNAIAAGGMLRLRPGFELQSVILTRLGAGMRGHPLHEIEDAFGRAVFLLQHNLNDLARFALGETALTQGAFAILIRASDNPFARSFNPWR